METKLDLNTLYKEILKTGWFGIGDDDVIMRRLSTTDDTKVEPFILLDKVMALPTRANLDRSGRDNLLIFHPLMEGLIGGESPVIGKLRRAYGIRFNTAAAMLFEALLAAIGSTVEHGRFTPGQMRLFTAVKHVDAKTLKVFEKLVKIATQKFGATNYFVDLYIRRNDKLHGQSYSRIALVKFPIYDELVKGTDKFYDTKIQITVKERKAILSLFEFVFPGIENKDAYSVGTNSRIAPYLDALLKAYSKLFSITNALYDEFLGAVEMPETISTELEWVEWTKDIEGLKTIAQSVPQQYGNYSSKVEDEKRQATGTSVQTPIGKVVTQAPAAATAPVVQPSTPAPAPVHQAPIAQAPARDVAASVPQFRGLGKPLAEANGYVEPPKAVDTSAVIINNSMQVLSIVDPVSAVIQQTADIIHQGGTGRVSATSASRPVSTGVAPGFATNHGFGGGQSNHGGNNPLNGGNDWNNNNNGFNRTSANVVNHANAAQILREQFARQLQPGAVINNGFGGGGSVI